jgi:hypothetical protein
MNLIRIKGELLYCAEPVEPGSVIQFTRIGEQDGIPVVKALELMPAQYMPQFAPGPGNSGGAPQDSTEDGEKWNEIRNDQNQVEGRPAIGRLPLNSNDDKVSASVRTAQNVIADPEDIPPMEGDNGDDRESLMEPPANWIEDVVEAVRKVGELLLLTIGGKSYLVVYDDECRRSGMGVGAKIRYRIMPERVTRVPGVGRMDVDEIQLGTVLIPAELGKNSL